MPSRTSASRPRALPALKPLAFALQLTCASALLAAPPFAPSAQAQQSSAARQYDIPGGALSTVLARFIAESGIFLASAGGLTDGITTSGLQGTFTVPQAFERLLTGTGLEAVQSGSDNWVLRATTKTSDAVLPTVTVQSDADKAVTEHSRSYAARRATTTGIEQSLKDIPQSITVVTRQRIEDQNLANFDDIVMQTPGVSRRFVNSGQSSYFFRGFNTTKALIDGMQAVGTFDQILGLSPDSATLDRVEVLRGANGMQVGAGTPGAVVNLVRKRPLAEKQLELVARVGSWGYKRGELDATGPLNQAGTLRGRTVLAYEDRHYFYDRAHSKVPLVYGVLEADLTTDTTLMAGLRFQQYDQDGLYAYSGLPMSSASQNLTLPRSYVVGPSWSAYKTETKELFAELSHRFNPDWTGKILVNKQLAYVNETNMVRGSRLVDPTTYQQVGNTSLYALNSFYKLNRHALDASLQGGFNLWGWRQELRIGASVLEETRDYSQATYTYAGSTFNANDPFFSSLPAPALGARQSFGGIKTDNKSLYANAVLHVADPLKFTLGGRLSWYTATNYNAGGVATSVSKQSQEFTPFAGLTYALTPQWSAYASYADIFEVQSTYATASGKALDPAIGSNYELGIKGEGIGGKWNMSAAIFRIDQTGRAAIDTTYPTGGCPGQAATSLCYVNGGKVRSQGLELEANGELLRNLQGWASYTYTNALYLQDRDAYGNATANEGKQFNVIPRHTFRLFATYDLPAQGWSVGGGVSAQSRTKGKDYNSIERSMGARAVWDGFARYRIDRNLSLALNINNLFDKTYYNDEFGYRYGEPRSMMLTLRAKY